MLATLVGFTVIEGEFEPPVPILVQDVPDTEVIVELLQVAQP
jgi:hypothetical protein